MKKILGFLLGAYVWFGFHAVQAAEKFDVLPDLPEPLAAAQASSVSTTTPDNTLAAAQTIGAEPNFLSVVFSLVFVILLIYATGIIYAKLNKLGFNTMKRQMSDIDSSKVAVVSTTQLGNNKSLHVVELDGKRMLIGASTNGINLLKDLGSCSHIDIEDGEFSKIEIPNIRIPKIEIPKIEFPNIGFTKASKNKNSDKASDSKNGKKDDYDGFEISEIYEESPDGIIDKLFTSNEPKPEEPAEAAKTEDSKHSVDPDEYVLYKKYL